MSQGMSVYTGKGISGVTHIEQSISQILTTPIGSRVMRRDFGSLLPELIDDPLNGKTRLMLYAATATALYKWEPRFRLSSVDLTVDGMSGKANLNLRGEIKIGSRWATSDGLTITLKDNDD